MKQMSHRFGLMSGIYLGLGCLVMSCTHLHHEAPVNTPTVTAQKTEPRIEFYDFQNLGELGGFSGLHFDRREKTDTDEVLYFWTLTDRGPNGESSDKAGKEVRPFLKPNWTPKIIEFRLFRNSKKLEVLRTIDLKWHGKKVSGLSHNSQMDEVPVDEKGKILPFDLHGVDSEGITKLGDSFWICEEYEPSILKVDLQGNILKRYGPGTGLPEVLKTRSKNRGLEGLTAQNGKIYAVMQSPLPNEAAVRLFEFNPETVKIEREFFYPLQFPKVDKIGDLASLGNGSFALIEQNGKIKEKGIHLVRKFDLSKANLEPQTLFDLGKLGWNTVEKMEGLTQVDEKTFAAVNDNDFNVQGPVTTTLVLVTLP